LALIIRHRRLRWFDLQLVRSAGAAKTIQSTTTIRRIKHRQQSRPSNIPLAAETNSLTGPNGPVPLGDYASVVRELADQSRHEPLGPATMLDLRRRYGEQLATLFVSVASLQTKANKKLGAGLWWVTPKSLQQATPWQVARYKSQWMQDRHVFDLCCGIGGDAVPLSTRGPLTAVDCDRALLSMTAANLASEGRFAENHLQTTRSAAPGGEALRDPQYTARVLCADVTSTQIPSDCFVHIDPDRRAAQTRTTRPDQYQPAWPEVLRIVDQSAGAAVKLAPAAQLEDSVSQRAHRAWISLQGSVREQSVLFGEICQRAQDARPGAHSAIAISTDSRAVCFSANPGARTLEQFSGPGEYLYDPDAAIRAAGLTEAFALSHNLATLAGPAGFLSSNGAPPDSIVRQMSVVGRVIWSGTCDDRGLRRELRTRKMFPQAIKVRGTDHDPAKMMKRLRECGDRPITLWIGRTSSRRFAAMTQPLTET
tara:strand:- start:363359 stop:364801 length:1443 start_codon:yes stop_codon:yes gene_type:complete